MHDGHPYAIMDPLPRRILRNRSRDQDIVYGFSGQLLTDEGTKVVKIFLNVSAEEQRARFQDRIDDPEEQWKFRLGDLDDRALWDDYRAAYRDALERTSTDDCPWYVVPADRKWVRNLAVARILVDALEAIDPQLPEPEAGLEGLVVAPLD